MKVLWGMVAAVLVGCGSGEAGKEDLACMERAAAIRRAEQALVARGPEPDPEARQALIRDYAAFANACHSDSLTPEFLFRRADLLRSAGKFAEAVAQLRDVHDHFPEYPHRARCSFLVAFINEVELMDRELGRAGYEQVLLLYPGTEEAAMAEQILSAWGLSDEELVRTFRGNGQPS
jgi:hypothetical protein